MRSRSKIAQTGFIVPKLGKWLKQKYAIYIRRNCVRVSLCVLKPEIVSVKWYSKLFIPFPCSQTIAEFPTNSLIIFVLIFSLLYPLNLQFICFWFSIIHGRKKKYYKHNSFWRWRIAISNAHYPFSTAKAFEFCRSNLSLARARVPNLIYNSNEIRMRSDEKLLWPSAVKWNFF